MNNQLRNGVERLKKYYIKKIVKSSHNLTQENELHSLTLSELEAMFRKIPPQKYTT